MVLDHSGLGPLYCSSKHWREHDHDERRLRRRRTRRKRRRSWCCCIRSSSSCGGGLLMVLNWLWGGIYYPSKEWLTLTTSTIFFLFFLLLFLLVCFEGFLMSEQLLALLRPVFLIGDWSFERQTIAKYSDGSNTFFESKRAFPIRFWTRTHVIRNTLSKASLRLPKIINDSLLVVWTTLCSICQDIIVFDS